MPIIFYTFKYKYTDLDEGKSIFQKHSGKARLLFVERTLLLKLIFKNEKPYFCFQILYYMKISLLVIGKTDAGYFVDAIREYENRLGHYIPFDMQIIPDIKNTKSLTEDQQRDKEGELILKNLQAGDYIVLLDERGKEFSSLQFATYIEKKTHTVAKRLVFIIGGPYGFAETIYNKASEKISLSKMTFSHQMIRLIFIEQLYRAMTILNNEPYHHE